MNNVNLQILRAKMLRWFVATVAILIGNSVASGQTYVNRVTDGQGGYSLVPARVTGVVTWPSSGSPYILEGWDWNLIVENGGSLTIEAGVVVSLPSSRDGGAIEVKGNFNVLGTAQNPVLFKRNETEGSWSGIRYMDGSQGILQHAVLEDSGHQSMGWQAWHPGAAVYAQNSAPTISNTIIRRSYGHGMWIAQAASPLVEDCRIEQSTLQAISWHAFWTNAAPTFRRNSGVSNHWDVVYVGNGTLSGKVTFAANDMPYLLQGWDSNLTVEKPGVVDVEPGVLFKSSYGREGSAVVVRGQMNSNGTSDSPVIFTSEYDDTLLGDTNQDGTNTTAVAGSWSGIRFQEGGTGAWKHTLVRAAGHVPQGWQGWHPSATFFITDSSPRLENVVIEASQGRGLSFANSDAEIINCAIRTTGGLAIGFEANGLTAIPNFTGTTASGSSINGICLSGSAGTVRLPVYDLPYVVYDWLTIPTNAVVTLAPGVLMMFAYMDNSSYKCGIVVQGKLQAAGTANQPIRFTSINDTQSRPAMKPVATQKPVAPGDWNGLYFDAGGSGLVAFCELFYAGYINENWNGYGGGAIIANEAAPHIANNLIWMSGGVYAGDSGHGMRFQNSAAVVESNVIDSVSGYAFAVKGTVTSAFPAFRENVSTNCGFNGIRLPTSFNTNTLLEAAGIPYIVYPNVLIPTNVTVQVAGGNVIKFGETDPVQGRMWTIKGRFETLGTRDHPVVITSLRDDTAGGDSNNDGGKTQPLDSGYADWAALTVNDGGSAGLAFTTLRYGGYMNPYWSNEGGGMIALWNGTVDATDCSFLNPGAPYGESSRVIYQRGGSLTLTGCWLEGGQYGLDASSGVLAVLSDCKVTGQTKIGVNNTSGIVVDARNTWWGDASGPLDSSDDRAVGGSYNPAGKGVAVSNKVLYDPWRNSVTEQITVNIYRAVEVEFSTKTGSSYVIQSSDLEGGPWIVVGEPIIGTGQPMHKLISTIGQPKRFYRVQLLGQ
jgi:hypothetical protein